MDFIDVKLLPPGDPKLIDTIVNQMKCQGIFDELRRESLADVDTTPAYQNLRHRVEGFVEDYLKDTQWRSDLNKNQLRDSVRRRINDSEMLTTGVDRIVDQVVTPKIHQVFLPKVTEIVHKFLGIEKIVTSHIQPKDEADQKSDESVVDVDGSNVSSEDVGASVSGETQSNLVEPASSITTEKVDMMPDKETVTKKVSKDRKEDSMKITPVKTVSDSQGMTVVKKQEQKSESKTKTTPSDKSKSKVDLSQKKVASSPSVKTKTTDLKPIIKNFKVTEKPKPVSKAKDQDTKDGTTKSGSIDAKDVKTVKQIITKAKPIDDKTKSIVKPKTDVEKTKSDVFKIEKLTKEQGKSKFSNSSRFRSLGSDVRKSKPKLEKDSKSTSNVIKAKPGMVTKSFDSKLKSTEQATEKNLKVEPSPSKNIDKLKSEKSASGSGHKRTSSESKSSKTESDGSSSKVSKTTKSNLSQKEENASQAELLNMEVKKEKVDPDEKLQQAVISEVPKKQISENLVRSSPTKLIGAPSCETICSNEGDKHAETKKFVDSQKVIKVESSPVAIDSESQSSLDEPSPRKARKQKRSKRDEDRGRNRHLSDDELSDITVSSVHTSDLSDFDDNITLTESDDDEDKKVELKKRNAEIIVDRWDVECVLEYLLKTVEEVTVKTAKHISVHLEKISELKEPEEKKEVPELRETIKQEELSGSKKSKKRTKTDPDFEPQTTEQNLKIKEEAKDDDWEPVKRKKSTQVSKPQTLSRDIEQKKSQRETLQHELERESESERSEIEPRRGLRRQRKLNPRYASDDFSSIFSRGSREQNLFGEVPSRGDVIDAQAPIRGRRLTGHSNTTDETDCALSPVSDFSEFGEIGKPRKLSVGSRGKLCSPSEGSECSDYSRSHEASTPDQSDAPELRPQTSLVSGTERKTKRECSKSPVEPPLPSLKMEAGRSTRRQSKSEIVLDSPPSTRQRTQRADRQRYDSTDLYKPRSTFTSSSRRPRGMSSSSSSSAAREESVDQHQEATQSVGKVKGRPGSRSTDAPSSPRGNKRSTPNPSSNYSIKRRCRV